MTHEVDSSRRLRRAPIVRIYDVSETTVVIGSDGAAHELSGDSAKLARALLSFTLQPRSRAEVIAHVEMLTGTSIRETRVVDDLLTLLGSARALVPEAEATSPGSSGGPRIRLILGLTGAIATSLAPELVVLLQRRGFQVRVVATESALRFVQAQVLEALIHEPVYASLWPEQSGLAVPHIALAQWADAMLICPATATTISRLAAGDHSTLVSAIALATSAPVMVVPSMNVEMYTEAAVQRNLAQLISDGFHVIHPGSGPELAHAPESRASTVGPMPPTGVVVELLETAIRIDRIRRAKPASPPRDAEEWDALFRIRPTQELAWHTDSLDDDLLELLARHAGPECRLLDIGTGLGTAAIEAARRGCRVVATDVSAAALERARERAHGAPILWVRDDITDSRLHGLFDLILDRGCLHLLPPDRTSEYAATVARLMAPDSLLLLKSHALSEGSSRGTTPYDAPSIERLLGSAFSLVSDQASLFPGPGETPAARLFVLRRR